MAIVNRMYKVLKEIQKNPGEGFSGLGIVVYDPDVFDETSHLDLRPNDKFINESIYDDDICERFKEISDYRNTFHVGFHFVDRDGNLTHVAQYFVPGIVKNLYPDQEHGVRLYSSMCGSTIPGVYFIATICSNGDIYIYENGKEMDLSRLDEQRVAVNQ